MTGSKIYARDFKASDFKGWPSHENWLYALRCNCVDRIVLGYDLSVLPQNLQPIAIVSNKTLNARRVPLAQESDPYSEKNTDISFFPQDNHPADCYGQPVALLIFEDFDTYRRARKILEFNDKAKQAIFLVDADCDTTSISLTRATALMP
ncbi:hypothetical protein G3N95_09870 [Paraburkholderia sp. Tr-20389]|uniref:hypothetical protein n=1 Tax=Paraburkholderia sp. Tr-20389 TaxID=2703903 RepID=UPI00197D1892|nr:hypothetical protein [Paraburkholderia sp. Tr-20389]MBN3753252.1 hypothetical protein [Paraburkholderia sp. Tr-20389]